MGGRFEKKVEMARVGGFNTGETTSSDGEDEAEEGREDSSEDDMLGGSGNGEFCRNDEG